MTQPGTPKPTKDLLQPTNDDARRLAKGLLRGARFAALAVLDPADGGPALSRVIVATTMAGAPLILISRLSAHFAALEADPRCALLVGEPGKGDPLAHPRMMLSGRAERLADGPERDLARARLLARHPKSALYADFPDFAFWRVSISRVSLNGGFARAFAPTPADVLCDTSGLEDLERAEAAALAHMAADHADAVDRYAALAGATSTGWRLTGVDPEGLDLVRNEETARVWFDRPLTSAVDLRPALVALARS